MKIQHHFRTHLVLLFTLMVANACTLIAQPDTKNTDRERLSASQAEEMITEYYHSQKPDLKEGIYIPVEEIPFEQAWSNLGIQIFRISDGVFKNESFLLKRDLVLSMGTAFGGYGLSSLEIGDIDKDKASELIFIYSFGSGIHQSRIGMYAPAYDDDEILEANLGYFGDIRLFKLDENNIGVQIIDRNDDLLIVSYLEKIGYLRIDDRKAQPKLIIDILPGLDPEIHKALFPVR